MIMLWIVSWILLVFFVLTIYEGWYIGTCVIVWAAWRFYRMLEPKR